MTKQQMRDLVRDQIDEIIPSINAALKGDNLAALRPTLERNGRNGQIPHWFEELSNNGTFPNLDGKSIGSVIEMLLIAVLETDTFRGLDDIPPLRVNPARGVDLPDLDLGIKSPSENYCTSEPFFSAYERLNGSEYDALVLLTDYQEAKQRPPLKLQIIQWRYVTKTQVADKGLCRVARRHRGRLLESGEARAQRLFRFLAYVNQSDWLGKKLVSLIDAMDDVDGVRGLVGIAENDFAKINSKRDREGKVPIPEFSLRALQAVPSATPLLVGVVDAADNWVADNLKDAGRLPNDNEWNRLKSGPLDGRIGMSPALQWRYNFGQLFGEPDEL